MSTPIASDETKTPHLPLRQVLKDEYESLHGGFPEVYLTRLFYKDHFRIDEDRCSKISDFAIEISGNSSDRFQKAIYEGLSEGEKASLTAYAELVASQKKTGSPVDDLPDSLQQVIVDRLNSMLEEDIKGLFDNAKDIEDSKEFKATLPPVADKGSAGAHRDYYLKRFLIEAAYPQYIHPINDTLSGVYAHIHKQQHTALCLSGGGIRSATFALGVLQGLARSRLLKSFHYLSTVSGGGYIGGWLSAWIDRHPNGLDGVADELTDQKPTSKLNPEAYPVRHLRSYSNYLTPKLGVMSADTWSVFGTVLRNMLLIWLVLIPLIAAVLMIPRISAAYVVLPPTSDLNRLSWVFLIGTVLIMVSVVYAILSRPSWSKSNRGNGWFLIVSWFPLMLSAIMLTSFWAWYVSSGKRSLESTFPFSLLARLGDSEVVHFIVYGASVFLLCVIVYGIIYVIRRPFRKPGAEQKRDIHISVEEEAKRKRKKQFHYGLEVAAITVSGVLFGWLCWLFATRVFEHPVENNGFYATFATPTYMLIIVMAATFFIGISSRWTDDDDREWWARAGSWVLIAILGWIVFAALVIYGPPLLGRAWQAILPAGGISGFITLWLGQSAKTDGKKEEQDGKKKKGAGSAAARIALMFAAPVFAAFIVIMISAGTSWLIYWLLSHGVQAPVTLPQANITTALEGAAPHIVDFLKSDGVVTHSNVILHSPLRLMWAILAALGAIGFTMGILINTNRFSLHAMYRNRLIRAYLGASNPNRKPNRFTGFDANDNIQMHDLWPANEEGKNSDRRRLIHVINQALNLVGGKDLAWQQRKAESFTVTPLHAGSHRLGYRKTDYGQGTEPQRFYGGRRDGISLGTAVTISGAAASPNMGYHSSAVVTFLMTLFNARLGWWLGNPGPEGNDTFHRDVPKFSVGPIISEAMGMTDDKRRYVYLSDGGHFENLGLYEMVLRRCRYIVVSDASQDSACNFQDLGNAIRKIRSDFGIPIDFTHSICIYGKSEDRDQNKKGRYCAVATIKYSWVDKEIEGEEELDGKLLYIKPAFYGQEPRDIYEYAKSSGQFPHESTVDQFFSESQFESYRMLGYHTLEQIRRGWTGNDIKSLIAHIEGVLSKD